MYWRHPREDLSSSGLPGAGLRELLQSAKLAARHSVSGAREDVVYDI
jgi:hypothetical protein